MLRLRLRRTTIRYIKRNKFTFFTSKNSLSKIYFQRITDLIEKTPYEHILSRKYTQREKIYVK